jgi:prevent-host-death family protein
MESILPFSEVKSHLSELADRVEQERDRIMVTRNGRPSFMLVNCDYLESLEETLDIMRDPELVDSLRKSRAEAEAGQRMRLRDHLRDTSA